MDELKIKFFLENIFFQTLTFLVFHISQLNRKKRLQLNRLFVPSVINFTAN